MNHDDLLKYLLDHLRLFHELKMRTGQLKATSAELDAFIASETVRLGAKTTEELQHIYWRNYVHEDFYDSLSTVPASLCLVS